jgi:hypothetical protein
VDLTKPVGVLLLAILHFVPDSDDPAGVVATLAGGLPLLAPGVVPVSEWRPDIGAVTQPCDLHAGVACLPRGHR